MWGSKPQTSGTTRDVITVDHLNPNKHTPFLHANISKYSLLHILRLSFKLFNFFLVRLKLVFSIIREFKFYLKKKKKIEKKTGFPLKRITILPVLSNINKASALNHIF